MSTTRRALLAPAVGPFPPATVPPFDASWARQGAILQASVAWEETAVVEIVVTYDAGLFKAWYRGGWANGAIGYATSTDGLSWTKYASNPVLGQGASGVAGNAYQPWVLRVGATWYLYWSPFGVATSSDGITWTVQAHSISFPSGKTIWGNRVVWREGSAWKMLQEAGGVGGHWATYLYTSSDGLTWAISNGGAALATLSPGGDSYGGPKFANVYGTVTPQFDGLYHLWYHACAVGGAGLPTNIYHATSPDLITWTITSPNPVLTHTGAGFEVDQVAGPAPLIVDGTAFLYYDGDDNVGATARLAVATAPAGR